MYLATNKLLYDMRKVDSPRCVFCNLQSETICHLFFECTNLKDIWYNVSNVCSMIISCKVQLSCSDVILGFFSKEINEQEYFINMVVLYVKHYILKCKYNMTNPTFNGLYQYMRYQSSCEKGLIKALESFY